MAWTNGNGVIIADEKGWTLAAPNYVPKLKKWGNGANNSAKTGFRARSYHVIMRALAEIGVQTRKRAADTQRRKDSERKRAA